MRVWITRTEPGASHLGSLIDSKGLEPVVAPVLRIATTGEPQPQTRTDVWVFVSSHAVNHAVKSGWTSKGRCMAVGPTTATSLRPFAPQVLVPNEHSSEGMYDLLRKKFPEQTNVCIITGTEGRRDLENWLLEDGYQVTTWAVYKRVTAAFNVDLHKIDVVLIGSATALGVVADFFDKAKIGLNTGHSIVVPSKRVASLANEIGFGSVVVANGASPDAMLDVLEELTR